MSQTGTATAATTPTSFLAEIKQDAIDAVNAVKADIIAAWNYEEPIFVAELKTLEQQLLGIAASAVTTVAAKVASGQIKSTEALSQLGVETYQTAVSQGLQVTEADAVAAAQQIAAATVVAVAQAKPAS